MSTFCSTGISFYTRDKQSIKQLKHRLDKIFSTAPQYSDCPIKRITDVFYPEISSEKIENSGVFSIDKSICMKNGFYTFAVYVQTPNSAKLGLWYKLLQDFYPDIKMAYIAEDSGNEYFLKWDEEGIFYPHKYYVDICYPTEDGEEGYIEEHGYNTLEEVFNWLDEHLPFDYDRKADECELEQEILSKLEELEDSDGFFCTIVKYMETNPREFDFYKN